RQGSWNSLGHSSNCSLSMTRAYCAFNSTRRTISMGYGSRGRSEAHVVAIGLPEAAPRGLGGARLLALGRGAAHLDHRHLVGGCSRAALHEAADAAVFHGDEAGWADQVLLLQPPPVHLGRIVLEAEVGPHEIHLVDAARYDLADRQAIVDLLQDEAREHR